MATADESHVVRRIRSGSDNPPKPRNHPAFCYRENALRSIRYPDGSVTKGAQIQPGRNGTNQGTSLACMVTDQSTYDALNNLFQNNYNNGGVKLIVNPGP
jgi:hypothetical protein